MVNFNALSASIILTSGLSVLATPVARDNLITYSLTKKTGQSIAAIIAKDQARLAHYNSQASSSVTVTNEDAAYVAAVKVGSQTVSMHFIVGLCLFLMTFESSTSLLTRDLRTRGLVLEPRM